MGRGQAYVRPQQGMPPAQERAHLLRNGVGIREHGELPGPAWNRGLRIRKMPGPIDYTKLRIVPDFDTREWWEGTKQHKYLVRQCRKCGHKWFPPTFPACGKCASMDIGWFETAGKGVLHCYVVVVQPIVGAFVGTVPYVVGVIELDDCRE